MPPPLDSSDFLFFNYLNPLAARTNAIQQAAVKGLGIEAKGVGCRLAHSDLSDGVAAGIVSKNCCSRMAAEAASRSRAPKAWASAVE